MTHRRGAGIAEQLSTGVDHHSLTDALGRPRDLTLIRGPGRDAGDPALAAARHALAGHIYREVAFERVCEVSGDTVALDAGPGFVRSTAHLLPRALAVAEMRFDHVIVLPTTFDLSDDAVRDVLGRTRATFVGAHLDHDTDPDPTSTPALRLDALPAARVTAVILCCEQPERALRAVDSVRAAALDTAVLVIDNNRPDADARALAAAVQDRAGVSLHRSDRNLGTAAVPGGDRPVRRCAGVVAAPRADGAPRALATAPALPGSAAHDA